MSNRQSQRPPSDDSSEYDDDPLDDPTDRRYGRPEAEYEFRPSLERTLSELIRRGFEVSRGPLGKVGESFSPRDLAQSVVAQLGDARSGIVKAVAHEVGRFLQEADIAAEIRKVLVGLDVDAHVRLRFSERDGRLEPKVEIRSAEVSGADDLRPSAPPAHGAGGRTSQSWPERPPAESVGSDSDSDSGEE